MNYSKKISAAPGSGDANNNNPIALTRRATTRKYSLSGILGIVAVLGAISTVFFPTICGGAHHRDMPITSDLSDSAPVSTDVVSRKKVSPKKNPTSDSSHIYYAYHRPSKDV
jgi:hypothetical protein